MHAFGNDVYMGKPHMYLRSMLYPGVRRIEIQTYITKKKVIKKRYVPLSWISLHSYGENLETMNSTMLTPT